MELNQIEAFVSVATLGGFTKASQHLHRTQPAVSRRVQLLEKSLGVNLFERRGREVRLTPEGHAFLEYAQLTISAMQDGIRAVNEAALENVGGPPISLAIVGTLANQHLTIALSQFRERYPTTEITLRTASSREVSVLVKRGDAEIGIRYFSDNHPDLVVTELGEEQLFLVASKDHKLSGAEIMGPDDLGGENFMCFPVDVTLGDSFGALLPRKLHEFGVLDPKITDVDSLTAQKRLVESGYGLALMPISSCKEEIEQGSMTILAFNQNVFDATEPVVALQRKAGFRRKRATELLELIKSAMALTG